MLLRFQRERRWFIEAYQGIEPPRRPVIIHDPGDKHAGTPQALWNNAFWRSWGEPWGGLVTTPAGALGLLRAYLGYPEGFLLSTALSEAIQDQTSGLGGGFPWQQFPLCPWGLGPMIFLENMQNLLFPLAPAGTIGMGGHGGCAVFAIPDRNIAWVVHGTRTAADPWWEKAFAEVSTAVLAEREPVRSEEHHMIEEMIGDLKRHGLDLESTMLHHDDRFSCLTVAVVLLYVWSVSTGARPVL